MHKDENNDVYLTIHGHFYQPPRENPWLEYIEEQESAAPFHDWNERINYECYSPNSVARITDQTGKILDINNNYTMLSYNFGPTLFSWLEENDKNTYNSIIEADKISQELYSGHGNAIAQVYNHIIMPLANLQDKITQVHWGIKDFEYRFGRKPEGIWLSEAAVCEKTLSVLVDYGIKYTILSPYQADKVKYDSNGDWEDVSRGNIDPARAYKYNLPNFPGKSIDVFFYDGSISKAIAFEGVLYNGDKLVYRIKDGIVPSRKYPQLIHLATDGESYGHHTPFGDMALAYGLKVKLKEEGFKLTNYGEYLEKHPPTAEAIVKDNTSWSCAHGIGRWKEDCGCSTGGEAGWNQKWRKPLREALDWLNEQLSELFEKEGSRYFKNPWDARNDYINIILDKSDEAFKKFFSENSVRELSNAEIIDALKLLDMQKNAMYMFTSCGWFFTEISGLETTQILKYAARAMQIAHEFGRGDLEPEFLEILSRAKSNIKTFGDGKDIYTKFVKPSVVSRKQIVSHWAITSLYEEYEDEVDVYSYKIKKLDYHREKKGITTLVIGRLEVHSTITREVSDMVFALLHIGEDDFHCVIRGFAGSVEYQRIKEDLFNKFNNSPITETIRGLDEHFGREYWTLKNLFIDKKKMIIQDIIKEQLEEFSTLYYKIYNDSQTSIMYLLELGLPIPDEFKIAAQYTLSRNFNNSITKIEDITDVDEFYDSINISKQAKRLKTTIDKSASEKIFKDVITQKMRELLGDMTVYKCMEMINIIEVAEELDIKVELKEAQNIFFKELNNGFVDLIKNLPQSVNYKEDKELVTEILKLGEKFSFNLDKYYALLSKNLVTTLPKSRTEGYS